MTYKVVLYRMPEGISVSCPALPGCWSEGDTEEEAMANIKSAIEEYLTAKKDLEESADIREVTVEAA